MCPVRPPSRASITRLNFVLTFCTALICLPVILSLPAAAQYFSNKDGYETDGTYRVQVGLAPYLWLPATSGSVHSGVERLNLVASSGFSTPVPAPSQLAASLHPSFMGFGIVRYGPYSLETDLQYVSASGNKTLFVGPLGRTRALYADVSYVRVAPGIGYTAWAGNLGIVPASVDGRVGFAYFSTWEKLSGLQDIRGGLGFSSSFAQPWVGGRLTLVPSPRWRIELNALAQGFGVDGGSWGWGATLAGSYALSSWATINLAFRALHTDREQGSGDTVLASRRSLSLTAYGPVLGIGFRF